MVYPIGGMALMADGVDRPPPRVIKEVHAKYWWVLLFFMIVIVVLEILSVRTFDAIFVGILAFLVWYQVRAECTQMTQYCLMFFGLLCLIQAIFEIISLVSSLSGRRTQHTTRQAIGNNQVTYTTKVQSHPFFDGSQGFTYNMQSVTYIVSPIVMGMGASLSYWSYSAFRSSMFAQQGDDGEEGLGGFGGQGLVRYGGNAYGNNGYNPNAGNHGNDGHRLGHGPGTMGPPTIFEGRGHRLSDS